MIESVLEPGEDHRLADPVFLPPRIQFRQEAIKLRRDTDKLVESAQKPPECVLLPHEVGLGTTVKKRGVSASDMQAENRLVQLARCHRRIRAAVCCWLQLAVQGDPFFSNMISDFFLQLVKLRD